MNRWRNLDPSLARRKSSLKIINIAISKSSSSSSSSDDDEESSKIISLNLIIYSQKSLLKQPVAKKLINNQKKIHLIISPDTLVAEEVGIATNGVETTRKGEKTAGAAR
jgi:hypothetical protein